MALRNPIPANITPMTTVMTLIFMYVASLLAPKKGKEELSLADELPNIWYTVR